MTSYHLLTASAIIECLQQCKLPSMLCHCQSDLHASATLFTTFLVTADAKDSAMNLLAAWLLLVADVAVACSTSWTTRAVMHHTQMRGLTLHFGSCSDVSHTDARPCALH